jgi:hypothetical protein
LIIVLTLLAVAGCKLLILVLADCLAVAEADSVNPEAALLEMAEPAATDEAVELADDWGIVASCDKGFDMLITLDDSVWDTVCAVDDGTSLAVAV